MASRAQSARARQHPIIVSLREHKTRVDRLGDFLAGAESADERNNLQSEDRERYESTKAEWPWTVGELLAHEQRVRLDHPKLFALWISAEIGAARRAKLGYRKWQAIRSRRSRWRIDVIEHPPRGDLFELELRSTWRVSEVETGRVVLERTFDESASFAGTWQHEQSAGVVSMRLEGDTAWVRSHSGKVEVVPLA